MPNPFMDTPEQLIRDLWWFIENVTDETPDRNDRFFALRERIREFSDMLDEAEPPHNDEVLCCPDCERPNQFGEQCNPCRRDAELQEQEAI